MASLSCGTTTLQSSILEHLSKLLIFVTIKIWHSIVIIMMIIIYLNDEKTQHVHVSPPQSLNATTLNPQIDFAEHSIDSFLNKTEWRIRIWAQNPYVGCHPMKFSLFWFNKERNFVIM